MTEPRLGFDSYTSEGDFYRDDSPEQQRIDAQRDFAFGGGLLKGITELPLDIMEFLSPEDEYNPGALAPDQSSARQRIRTERLHGEQFYDELKSDPITKQAAEVGYGASMVVDPVLDTGILMAPHLLKGLNAIRKGEKPAIKLADLMTDEVGAVGDIAYHGTSSDVQKFDPAKFGESTQAKSAKQGVWLVSDPNTAHGYADYSARNAPVEAKIREANAHEKRGDWDAYDESLREVEELEAKFAGKTDRLGQNIMPLKYEGDYHIEDMEGAEFMDNQRHIDAVIEGARDKGKDGVIFQNLSDDAGVSNRPAEHTVVFDPKNVKSAFDTPIDKGATYPMAPEGSWWGEGTYKAGGGEIVNMTPDAFLNRAKKLDINEYTLDNVNDLKQHIEEGNDLDPLTLYDIDIDNVRASDGRHRALAAKELGIKEVPVVVYPDAKKKIKTR